MKKTLFADQELKIGSYNGFNILTNHESVVRKNPKSDCIFEQMSSQTEVSFMESGFYKIVHTDNSNKNLKINIAHDIKVIIFEENIATDDVNLNHVELNLSSGSVVEYCVLDDFKNGYANRKINLEANAKLKVNTLSLATSNLQSKYVIDLNGDNALADFKLVTASFSRADLTYSVTINNNAKNTSGNIWQKGVCQDAGRITFDASGFIKKGCDFAKNFQESRVLLLDGASFGEASPNLLIDHYNVEAGHAASVSRVDDEQLYYLQTRGLAKVEAERLMTLAFIQPLFDSIKGEDIATQFKNNLLSRLGIDER